MQQSRPQNANPRLKRAFQLIRMSVFSNLSVTHKDGNGEMCEIFVRRNDKKQLKISIDLMVTLNNCNRLDLARISCLYCY